MGAWGHGHFQNDWALDFLHNIEAAENPKKVLGDTFTRLIKRNYIDADDASAAIVAATMLVERC